MAKKTNNKIYIPLLVISAIVLFGVGYYYYEYLKYETTDDALLDSDYVALGPKIMGRIAKLYVQEGDSVKSGQLVAELDSTDLYSQKQQAIAAIAQMNTNVEQAVSKLAADKDNLVVLEINAAKAKTDFDRAQKQKSADIITQEQFENYRKNLESASAQLKAAQSMLKVSKAQIEAAKASVNTAKAQAAVISTQLGNTKIYAPFDGKVAKRWLIQGDIAQPGQSIFTINNDKNLWVSVYIEETKLKNIKTGQRAIIDIDAIPGKTFYGKVFFIGNNTASRFALIPPSNASGNFTKITQRVQLKLSVDSVSNGGIAQYNLLPGMSAVVKLIK